jgi:hypothetical protein
MRSADLLLMSGIFTRLVLVVALVFGAAIHGSTAVVAMDDGMAPVAAEASPNGCGACDQGTMKPGECAAACAIAAADLAGVASILYPALPPSWPLADRSANGLWPTPDPTPPRA